MKKIISTLLAASMIGGSFAGTVAFAKDSAALNAAEERTLAFPEAQGGGMYSKGARASEKMEVYHVTNLNDSGPGSFRDAVSKSGRFVVFDVSGMIDLMSNVTVRSNTTILGQTAPGDGICIRGNNVKISGDDIIVRYIRFRVGAHMADGSDTRAQDGLEVTDNSQRVIIDHCSVSWGTDENLSAYAVKDVTIQNSIIAEALNQSVHDKGEHSYAAIWGGVNLTVHHNIIATHKSRNPKIGTSETVSMTSGYTDAQTVVDIRNNIFYNWGDKAGYGAENGANVNIINNYYKPGPATPSNKRARIFEFSSGNKYEKGWSGAVYADGNFIDDDGADAALVNENNWQPEKKTGVYADGTVLKYVKLDEPNSTYIGDYPVNTTSAQEAYEYVLENAGARLPKLDVVDERIIEDVKNGTAPNGSKGSVGLVDDPTDTVPDGGSFDDRGYPVWESEKRGADYDTDGDGIPDEWEIAENLNPQNPNDALNIACEGYTWLEIYANGTETGAGDFSVNVDGKNVTATVTEWDMSSGAPTLYIDGESFTGGEVPGGYHSAVLYSPGKISAVKYIMIHDGDTALTNGQTNGRMPEGDYRIVSKIEPSNLTKGAISYIYAGDYAVGCGYDENYNKKIYYGIVGAMEESRLNADEYPLFKIEYTNGFVNLYVGQNLAQWQLLESHAADLAQTGWAVSEDAQETITMFTDTAYVTEETRPAVKINNYKDGDRLGFSATLDLTLIPDNAEISQVIVYFNDEIIASQSVSGTSAMVPIRFSDIARGTLKVECIDKNLCVGSTSIDIYVSGTLTPWKITEIGDVSTKAFASVTNDYTYKINAPDGYIGGDRDACGYVYQKFTGDARIYYRSRMQGASQFGIMLRSGLEADADMYWFGGEYNAIGTQKLTYDLKHRGSTGYSYENGIVRASVPDGTLAVAAAYDERGALTEVKTAEFAGGAAEVGDIPGAKVFALKSMESLEPVKLASGMSAEIDYTFDNQQANLYFIAEKAGDKLNIYQTENGATVYKTKTLLVSIDCSNLGDEYYMGFAAAGGGSNPADAGWVSIDNNSGDNRYVWNFDTGLDWLWQLQDMRTLVPSWTNGRIGNDTMRGKMVLKLKEAYTSDRYIFHEYQMDDTLMPELSIMFNMIGENPAMNIYFQTGDQAKAYKAAIADGIMTSDGQEIGAVNASEWYTLKIKTDMTSDGAAGYLSLINADGEVIAADVPVSQVTGTEFREQKNVEKKTPVTKAVYLEPKAGSEGTYYIDNVEISGNEASVKVTRTENWYSFAGVEDKTFSSPITINGVTEANGTVESGTAITVSGGIISTNSKKVDGINFSKKCRINGTAQKITVPVTNGAVVSVYAASASSSEERVLRIDGNAYPLTSAVRSEYVYEGEGDSIEIYAEKNIDVYGISVITTIIE